MANYGMARQRGGPPKWISHPIFRMRLVVSHVVLPDRVFCAQVCLVTKFSLFLAISINAVFRSVTRNLFSDASILTYAIFNSHSTTATYRSPGDDSQFAQS